MHPKAYTDDLSIKDHHKLFRRIPPWHIFKDDNLGRYRPTSAAFRDHDNGTPMSVFLDETLKSLRRESSSVLAGHAGFSLSSVTAGLVRKCHQGVAREELNDEPSHGLVFGEKTDSVRKKLAKNSAWIIPPEIR